jgi:ribosomal protein S18 acetylase RimI-like enzyme
VQSELTYAITPAGPGDAAQLARVHVRSWQETYRGILPQPYLDGLSIPRHARQWSRRLLSTDEVTLAAEGAEGLVGYCSGGDARWNVPGEAEITTLYVLREAQGAGLGRRLLTDTARVLADRGATKLVIWVLRDNAKARAFYERMGGRLDGRGDEAVGGAITPSVSYVWSDLAGLVGR